MCIIFRNLKSVILIVTLLTCYSLVSSAPTQLDAITCQSLISSDEALDTETLKQCMDIMRQEPSPREEEEEEETHASSDYALDKRGILDLGGLGLGLDLYAFLGTLKSCNVPLLALTTVLKSLVKLDVNVGVVAPQVIPALVDVTVAVQTSTTKLQGLTPCKNTQVSVDTYAEFQVLVNNQIEVLTFIHAHASLWLDLNLKSTLHSHLLDLRTALNAYVSKLFIFISVDLDVKLNLRGSLSTSLDLALQACL